MSDDGMFLKSFLAEQSSQEVSKVDGFLLG